MNDKSMSERELRLARELGQRLDAGDLSPRPDDDPELVEMLQFHMLLSEMIEEPDPQKLARARRRAVAQVEQRLSSPRARWQEWFTSPGPRWQMILIAVAVTFMCFVGNFLLSTNEENKSKQMVVAVTESVLLVTVQPAPTGTPTPPAILIPVPATSTPTPVTSERVAILLQQLDDPWSNDDWAQVIVILTQVRALDPSNQTASDKLYAAYINYGQSLLGQGKIPEAVEQFQRALLLKPDRDEARIALLNLTPSPTPPSAASLPFSDNFASGLSRGWLRSGGDWNIVDGKLVNRGSDGIIWLGSQEWSGMVVTFNYTTLTSTTTSTTGNYSLSATTALLVRMQDVQNYVAVRVLDESGAGIYLVENGRVQWQFSSFSVCCAGAWKIVVVGDNIEVYKDDRLVARVADQALASNGVFSKGSVGFYQVGGGMIDDVTIRPIFPLPLPAATRHPPVFTPASR